MLIPGGDVGYASLDDVWLKEKYIYGRPRKHQIDDLSKLSPVEQRTVALSGSDSKGPTPEKARPQLLKDKGMEKGRIGMDHFAIRAASPR